MFNENHAMARIAKLSLCSREDIRNMVLPSVQQYLKDKYKEQDEHHIENQLFCDEPPLSSMEMIQQS